MEDFYLLRPRIGIWERSESASASSVGQYYFFTVYFYARKNVVRFGVECDYQLHTLLCK